MTTTYAREWLLMASLAVCLALFGFVMLAPLVGYPLSFPQGMRLLQTVLPVLLGYVGSAAHFLFRPRRPEVRVPPGRARMLRMLVQGPVVIFVLVNVFTFIAFGVSNRPGISDGSGMRVDELGMAVSIALAFLTVVTNVVAAYLYATEAGPWIPARP